MTPTPTIAIASNAGTISGAETMLLAIADGMRVLGHRPLVIGPASPSELVDRAAARGFDTHPVPAATTRAYQRGLAAWRLRNLRIPLWCNGPVPAAATIGMGRRIIEMQDLPVTMSGAQARIVTVGADRVIVPSAFMAARIPGGHVMMNWTEDLPFMPRELPADGPLTLGFMGRLTPEKGLDVLLDAVHILNDRLGGDYRLVIAGDDIGDDADFRSLQRQLSALGDRVELAGRLSREEFRTRVDLAVIPSVAPESFGLVAAEALAMGLPVVVSDAGALPEVMGEMHPWIARSGDASALADAIRGAVSATPVQHTAMVQEGRDRWEEMFSPRAGHRRLRRLLLNPGIAHV